jgi:uncharacterized membrane protein
MPKKKFDTNPLDPEFPKKVAEAQPAETEYKLTAETKNFPAVEVTDEQTRKFQEEQFQSAYNNAPNYQPPVVYQASRFVEKQPVNRKVDKVGLPENILVALPYLPWGIGLVAGFIELLIVPNSEPKTRFHAAQGFALNIGILLISFILGVVNRFSDWASFGNTLFWIAMTVLSIYWAYKAYKGEPVHIESVDDLTNLLEEKIKLK